MRALLCLFLGEEMFGSEEVVFITLTIHLRTSNLKCMFIRHCCVSLVKECSHETIDNEYKKKTSFRLLRFKKQLKMC